MTVAESIAQGEVPEWEECVKMICAHLEFTNKKFVTIAINPKTKEVAWDFDWQDRPPAWMQ